MSLPIAAQQRVLPWCTHKTTFWGLFQRNEPGFAVQSAHRGRVNIAVRYRDLCVVERWWNAGTIHTDLNNDITSELMTQKTTISFSIFPSFLLFRGIDLHGRDSVAFFNVIQFKKPPMMILFTPENAAKRAIESLISIWNWYTEFCRSLVSQGW